MLTCESISCVIACVKATMGSSYSPTALLLRPIDMYIDTEYVYIGWAEIQHIALD